MLTFGSKSIDLRRGRCKTNPSWGWNFHLKSHTFSAGMKKKKKKKIWADNQWHIEDWAESRLASKTREKKKKKGSDIEDKYFQGQICQSASSRLYNWTSGRLLKEKIFHGREIKKSHTQKQVQLLVWRAFTPPMFYSLSGRGVSFFATAWFFFLRKF